MSDGIAHIKICLFVLIGTIFCTRLHGQQTISYDITTATDFKKVFLFNTQLPADSAKLKNKAGRPLPDDNVYALEFSHIINTEFILFEADGSALIIDTGGNFLMRNLENFDAKPIPLHINIDTLGLGRKNLIIECSNRDLENLVVYAVPYSKYRLANAEPAVNTKLSFRLEEIIYGAKGKIPPRLIDLWREQIKFDPENRKILYDFKVILPKDMLKRGTVSLMIYDLTYQVVAIFPELKKPINTIKRDNIITNTYVYKIFINGDEEVKKGLIHFLSPEDEEKKQKALEEQQTPPAPQEGSPEKSAEKPE